MQIEVSIPDDVAQAVAGGAQDLSRAVIEALALEGYRSRRLSEYQVQIMLGFPSRWDVHRFLKEREMPLNYSLQDLLDDIETSRGFETAGLEGSSNAA